jgi:hypothetical protein
MSASTLWVDGGGHCAGFIIYRGKTGHEAFTGDEKSPGIFQTQDGAVAAVFQNEGISNDEGIRK